MNLIGGNKCKCCNIEWGELKMYIKCKYLHMNLGTKITAYYIPPCRISLKYIYVIHE